MKKAETSFHTELEWRSLAEHLDSLTVLGKHGDCRKVLDGLNPNRIPRKFKADFADIGWRVNDYLFALKALQKVIYPENSFTMQASHREKIIYGTSLSSLGATFEAIAILKQIDTSEEPLALFHLASAQMHSWNYDLAIPYLNHYIESPNVTPYRKLVGKLNLAAAFIQVENWLDALETLTAIQNECQKNNYHLLLGNALELEAQIEFFRKSYDKAEKLLERALIYLKDQSGNYSMYVHKWQALCKGYRSEPNSKELQDSLAGLEHVKKQALALKHWSTLRECDLFESILTCNQELFRKVIVGTPSEAYRQRARKLFNSPAISLGHFRLTMIPSPAEEKPGSSTVLEQFDPYQRTSSGDTLYRKPLLFELFEALTMDFYQPQTLAMIHQRVYPSEKFNPYSSPGRVLQLLRRLNQWFVCSDLPLRIDFAKSEFQIITHSSIQLVLARGEKRSASKAKINELKNHFKGRRFTIQNVCSELKISKSTAERILRGGIESRAICKERSTNGLVYRIQTTKKLKATG